MPLEAPKLDARTFEEILNDARLRIPRYTPEWTNFNDSDPGMALVQLFAWFTETMFYQFNQVPEQNYIKFLQMLNLERRPARAAKAHVALTAQSDNAGEPIAIPQGTRFEAMAADDSGDIVTFESTRALDLCPFPLDSVQILAGLDFAVVSKINEKDGGEYFPLGRAPQPGNALYLGFAPRPALTPPSSVPPKFPREIVLRVYLPSSSGQMTKTPKFSTTSQTAKPSQTLVWEYRSIHDADLPDRWRPLEATDETRALTSEGFIRLRSPSDARATIEGKLTGDGAERYWLRARLAQGVYADDAAPRIAFVRANVVEVENLVTIFDEEVGNGDGSKTEFQLRRKPIVESSLELQLERDGQEPEKWVRVADFLASKPADTHYTVNPATGVIKFGDGRKGRVPEPSSRIVASRYRYGGGSGGNVKADALNQVSGPLGNAVTVTNSRPALGGAAEESMDDLKQRAPSALRGDRGRAVTCEDFRRLAEEIPGVLKAHALANRHPEYPGLSVPGAITILIVPDSGESAPSPSQQLSDLVLKTLEAKRLVTTELFVVGPRYRRVDVTAKVRPAPNASPEEIKKTLSSLLQEHLKPKRQSFGATLYPGSFYQLLLNATGSNKQPLIVTVISLRVTVDDKIIEVGEAETFAEDELATCGNIVIQIGADIGEVRR